MPDLDLSALRKVAEAANRGIYSSWGDAEDFDATFTPNRILALLDDLENLRITAKADRQYVEETDDRVKPYLARAWWEGVTAQWTHLPPGNRVPQSENPYRQAGDG